MGLISPVPLFVAQMVPHIFENLGVFVNPIILIQVEAKR
jgi:hypothetical protein